ncbi:cytochrome P450 [Xylariomycetidae sp. FL0641]|nr:cytochrome P450 [Xylariomycetidae sp. FL0641]
MIPGYSGSENLTLEGDVDICVRELVALIRRGYGDGRKPMDLAQKLQFLTLDVISTLGFGQCFGLLEADADPDEYLKSTEDGLKINNRQIGLGTWWTNWIPFVGPCADPDMATARGFDKILALSNANVEVRERAFRNQQDENGQVGGDRGRPDMLTSFLKNGLSGQTLKSEVVLQIVAGSDTTAGGLRGVMLYLLTNPRVYRRLQGEIDDAVKHGLAPAAPDVISHAQARKLPYLQAVIREAMRVFPPITNPLARDVPRGGDVAVIDGQKVAIPEGVSIIPSFTEMYRSAGLFGDDADVFRPERWIEELDPKRLNAMKKANDQVFGAGRWMCLGKNVAMLEMSKVIFELLRNFDWGLINPEKPWKIAALIGLRSITDFWVHVQERS